MPTDNYLKIGACSPPVLVLIYSAVSIIGSKYGDKGISPKPYHNEKHTADVIEAVSALSDAGILNKKLDRHKKELLLIAAAYHDIEHSKAGYKNELASSEVAAKSMRLAKIFSEEDVRLVASAIMATCVHFDGEGRMTQSATADYLTQLLADADLAHLGGPTETFAPRMRDYFVEINHGSDPDSAAWADFLEEEVSFIKNHHFYTEEAKLLFPNESKNLDYVSSLRAL